MPVCHRCDTSVNAVVSPYEEGHRKQAACGEPAPSRHRLAAR